MPSIKIVPIYKTRMQKQKKDKYSKIIKAFNSSVLSDVRMSGSTISLISMPV
jgi:hypothetical protein